jgi:hypothetical protein
MTIPRQGVHTAPELHRSTRRLDRNVAAADRALTAMREGRSLHLQYQAGFPIWSLSGGAEPSPQTSLPFSLATRPSPRSATLCLPAYRRHRGMWDD